MKSDYSIEEKKEILISNYELCFDLDIARAKIDGLTDEEFDEIIDDEYFHARINLIDSEIKETLIMNLLDLVKSKNESVSLKATLELGKMLYEKKFNKTKDNSALDELKRKPVVVLMGKYPEGEGNEPTDTDS